ncbi:hypothetical protein [Rhodocytophaga rosea]|uniref:hypothetical protein n=1 Tax=Rhodocytophaga rosea TaxID=2704465 RepID=UPI00293BF5E4|nr:hypothetical protein [Rhodocytophaga rosea]
MNSTFETYLAEKKIDSQAFRENEPQQWQELYALFEAVHPESFTVQKKFLINNIRRQYPLKTPVVVPETEPATSIPASTVPPPAAKPARPVLKRPVIEKKPEQEE